jgi:hypothetical protein
VTSVAQAPPRLSALLTQPLVARPKARAPVTGLVEVRLASRDRAPSCSGSPSAVKGLRFERAVGRALAPLAREWDGHLFSGQWLRFRMAGRGLDWAQPDHYVVLEDRLLLLECKLSAAQDPWNQIERVYGPLLSALYGLPLVGCAIYHYLVGRAERGEESTASLRTLALGDLEELLDVRWAFHAHDPKRLA